MRQEMMLRAARAQQEAAQKGLWKVTGQAIGRRSVVPLPVVGHCWVCHSRDPWRFRRAANTQWERV